MVGEQGGLYSIGAFAKLTGVTERTLRFYDRKGLLAPSSRNEHGHRYYTEKDLMRLQQILTLKYLDFSLEDINAYLQRPEEELQHTLAMQFELLEQKKRQLEQVLVTIGRMRRILEGAGKVDNDLLLLLIHNLQHEERQKRWLSGQMPPSMVEAIFMEKLPEEQRLELERRMTVLLARLKEHYREGRHLNDEEVLACGWELSALLEQLIGPVMSGLSEQELAQMEALGDPATGVDPVLFPNLFAKEEEAFLQQLFEHLGTYRTMMEGKSHEQ
ncbi:MerR family transcriptional regulator [Paenibacillus arenilitoris]|uniref:MerR family transcriptional regulator n=1 Tax=Paenibacillus arenilitoris TaxID=2772299 RepID=A0A927H8T3_9BACL|nr:MerR family transcriptional regulator [Paenibacillus arenilitoris]MBD2870934.1 MerR family transcriptional regulator [Paenibacillus arenilitoris]